jgi:hypothetical protein
LFVGCLTTFFNWICYTALNRRIVVDDEFSKVSPFDVLPVYLRQVTNLMRKSSLQISRRRDRAVSSLVLQGIVFECRLS